MFFFPILNIGTSIVFIYILAAVLPSVYLMRYVYKMDRLDQEPSYLITQLIKGGVYAALLAMVLEWIADAIINGTMSSADPDTQAIVTAISVAVIEEGSKFYFLKKYTWNDYNFNCRYDGIVYAVMVSLGFAAFENILYVFIYAGLSSALPRALLSVPGHMGFSVYMGLFYGRAKLCEARSYQASGKNLNLAAALLSAISLHAFYDGTLMVGSGTSMILFFVYAVLMYLVVFRTVKKESETDEVIY